MMIQSGLIDKVLLCLHSGTPSLQNLRDALYLISILSKKEHNDIPNYYEEVFNRKNSLL